VEAQEIWAFIRDVKKIDEIFQLGEHKFYDKKMILKIAQAQLQNLFFWSRQFKLRTVKVYKIVGDLN